MSANLAVNTQTGEKAAMAVGKKMWHGEGIVLDQAQTAAEALKLSGLDYKVGKSQMYHRINKRNEPVENQFVSYRKDTKEVLGMVSDKYEILQNVNAFDFFDHLVNPSDEDAAMYHTAGAIGKGEKVWIQAKMPAHIKIGKNDLTEMYVTLMNSHNGRSAVAAYMTPVRVVCENTLRASLRNSQDKVTFSHIGNVKEKIKSAAEAMNAVNLYAQEMQEALTYMNSKQVNVHTTENFVNHVLPLRFDKHGNIVEGQTRQENQRIKLLETIETGVGQDINKGTNYWLYNGFTRFIDDMPQTTIGSTLDGSAQRKRNRAFEYLTK